MRRGWSWSAGAALAMLPALLLAGAGGARAQEGAVAGVVVDARTQQPLAGAQVVVEGTQRGTLSDAGGRFRIERVGGPTATLRVVMLGYRTATQEARVGDLSVRLALEASAIDLDQIVVTGTPGGTQRRAIGNVVARVDARRAVEVAQPRDVQAMLSTRVPGLRIMKASGDVGTGGSTRIRGVGSLSLSTEPLVYVDGIRVDNDPAAASSAYRRGDKPSRINDINPDEIESIEVIKGPAAATLYGTEASNGVIQIITRRGRTGEPVIELGVRQGANFLRDPVSVFPRTYYRDASGQLRDFHVIEEDIRSGIGNPFTTGHAQGYNASLSGGTGPIRYYLGGDYDRDVGVLAYNWQNRLSARSNFSYVLGDRLEVTASLGTIRSKGRTASTNQPLTSAIIWANPATLGTVLRGYRTRIPEWLFLVEGVEEVDRTTASVDLTHRPASWLNHRLTVGTDGGNNRSFTLYPRDPQGSLGPFGSLSEGYKEVTSVRNGFTTINYSATVTLGLGPDLTAATSGGAQYHRKQTQTHYAEGRTFPVPGVETVSAAATRTSTEDFLENKTFGLFVQEQLGWKNRIFLTGALRGDDNSAFGQNFDFVVYPKLSGTWVVSEEPFFRVPVVGSLKLRAAWGRAGQQPDVFAAARLYQPASGRNGVPTLTPSNIGNPDLKPEVGEELEVGFDASLLDERVTLEFTHYRKVTRDAILEKPTVPSEGFPGFQFVNLGRIRNRGIEVAVNAELLRRAALGWNLGFTLSTNKNRIEDLGGVTPAVFGFSGRQRHVAGFPLGGIYGRKVLSAELDAAGRVVNAMCEGGDPVTGGGPAVPCAQAGLAYWGQPIPEWEGGVFTDVTLWRRVRLHALVDFVGGHWRGDNDLAASHLFFNNSLTSVLRNDPILEAYRVFAGSGAQEAGLVEAGFAKLRTLSAAYDLPGWMTAPVNVSRATATLSADNVATLWRAQDGTFGRRQVDPEIRSNTERGLNAFNQEKIPPFTRLLFSLRLTL